MFDSLFEQRQVPDVPRNVRYASDALAILEMGVPVVPAILERP